MAQFVKAWTVKPGDNLLSIATVVYGDPRRWRPIADANNIDSPLRFPDREKDVGRILLIPREKS
jgi:nucleoid-associated protein YgaU